MSSPFTVAPLAISSPEFKCLLDPWWLRWLRINMLCRRPVFDPWVRKIPWRREWLPTPVSSPGEFHGQRSLAGYSPWGHIRHNRVTNTFTSDANLSPLSRSHSLNQTCICNFYSCRKLECLMDILNPIKTKLFSHQSSIHSLPHLS